MKKKKFNFKIGDKVKGECWYLSFSRYEYYRVFYEGTITQYFDDDSYEVTDNKGKKHFIELYQTANLDTMSHGEFTSLEKILYNVVDTGDQKE